MNVDNQLVAYVIVRSELGMSAGKVCAQVGHSIQYLMENFFKVLLVEQKLHDKTCEHNHIEETSYWLKNGSTKIVLKASDKQWDELKEAFGKECFIVRDAGLTEIKAGEETVMVLWPGQKSKAHKFVKALPLL